MSVFVCVIVGLKIDVLDFFRDSSSFKKQFSEILVHLLYSVKNLNVSMILKKYRHNNIMF